MDSAPLSSAEPMIVVSRVKRGPAAYVPALGLGLRVLLYTIFAGFAILAATGLYLSAVSLLNWWQQPYSYTNSSTLWVFLAHSAVGVVGTVPFLLFVGWHYVTSHDRKNRLAVKLGILVALAGLLICLTGFALIQLEGLPQLPTGTISRTVVYWAHIIIPFGTVWLYVRHRQAGPRIRWKAAKIWGGLAVGVTAIMLGLHLSSDQTWFREGPKDGEKYFEPSLARTADGKFISADVLMMDQYCQKCHADVYEDHFHSAHKFSSFNNPAYLFSVKETREQGLKRDGNVQSSRWCAGCHDPVPFFSGQFDDPNYDIINNPTAHAGITCTVCHSMIHENGTLGNAAYTIEEPQHYPFAQSDNTTLQWLNHQLVKAKPDFHKQTFLKPFHKTAEFCATCHKVSLPGELTHYKEFLRGQNHYDSYLLSGVSGHGVRSFYYPPSAKANCAGCHMPTQASTDFGAQDFDNDGIRKVHNHRFTGANTGLFEMLKQESRYSQHSAGFQKTIEQQAQYLRGKTEADQKLRIDIFGLKPGMSTDTDGLVAPLRPQLPPLEPGKTYTVEVVVRTLAVGHHFSQGTVDSNEIWVDFEANSNGKIIGRNGGLSKPNDTGEVDRWAHFINVLMLDRKGERINRRNAQDIFTPLYNKQIAPGAAAVLHYRLDIPQDVTGPIEITAKVRYRKFDDEYMKLIYGSDNYPTLPIVDMCADRIVLPIVGQTTAVPEQISPIQPSWQRWNDYGIGNLLEGGGETKSGHFKQAEIAFQEVLKLGEPSATPHGHLNLARVDLLEGRLREAAEQLNLAGQCEVPAPWWTRAWFTALVNSETASSKADLDSVIQTLRTILDPKEQPSERGFDFTKDYLVWNKLAATLLTRSQSESRGSKEQNNFLMQALQAAQRTLALESENMEAHDLLKQVYSRFADEPAAETLTPTSAEELAGFLSQAEDANQPESLRLQALHSLAVNLGELPRPRIKWVRNVITALQPLFLQTTNPNLRAALASALTAAHREAHMVYKPDEIARSQASQTYRQQHPEANYAARTRVIYPTTEAHQESIRRTGELPPLR